MRARNHLLVGRRARRRPRCGVCEAEKRSRRGARRVRGALATAARMAVDVVADQRAHHLLRARPKLVENVALRVVGGVVVWLRRRVVEAA